MDYLQLKLSKSINRAEAVGDLAERGCPICGRRLYAEASSGFGSLHCPDHSRIWIWIPTFRERDGYAPTAWKNVISGEMSSEFRKRHYKGD